MLKFSIKTLLLTTLIVGLSTGCKKKEDDPAPAASGFRPSMSTASFSNTTSYNKADSKTFTDAKGDSTVDRTEGRVRLAMFKALDAYAKKGTSQVITETTLNNMFANTNSPFSNVALDGSGLNVKEKTSVPTKLEDLFADIATASTSFSVTASKGTAGTLSFTNTSVTPNTTSKYLVNEKGVEIAQVISKSLIGSFQLEYIGNTLLAKLGADNSKLVTGKNYTQLEHNWDEAYGLFTINDIYCLGATDAVRTAGESFLGSYAWEYNKAAYPKLHEAFLKGRAAIVNNDLTEVKKQSDYIRTQLEKAIAAAAVGYMAKASDVSKTDAERAHAFGEGFGFIYSLRFCKMYGADAAFSDEVTAVLFPDADATFYDISAANFTTASNKIKAKFNL